MTENKMLTFASFFMFSLGALIPAYLISRLFIWLAEKFFARPHVIAAHVLTLLVSGALYSFFSGYNMAFGLSMYALPQFFWLAFDFSRFCKDKSLLPEQEKEKKEGQDKTEVVAE